MSGRPWTPEEDAALRRVYGLVLPRHRRGSTLLRALPGRTLGAIRNRVQDLGLRAGSCRPWTPQDDAYLRREWGDTGLRQMALRLRRTKTAVLLRSKRLGLAHGHNGIPAGYASIAEVCRRTGYCDVVVRRVLAEAGVSIYRVDSLRAEFKLRRVFVDRDDAEEALRAYDATLHETETVADAARRHGVHRDMLTRWLEDAGLRRPAGRGHAVRLLSVDIDRVVAQHRPQRRAA